MQQFEQEKPENTSGKVNLIYTIGVSKWEK